jgi:hypothetical protein
MASMNAARPSPVKANATVIKNLRLCSSNVRASTGKKDLCFRLYFASVNDYLSAIAGPPPAKARHYVGVIDAAARASLAAISADAGHNPPQAIIDTPRRGRDTLSVSGVRPGSRCRSRLWPIDRLGDRGSTPPSENPF